jgi:hypothetical protein
VRRGSAPEDELSGIAALSNVVVGNIDSNHTS